MSGRSFTRRLVQTVTAAALAWVWMLGLAHATTAPHDASAASPPVPAVPAVPSLTPTSVLPADQAPAGAIPRHAIFTAPPEAGAGEAALLQGGGSSGPQLRYYALDALGSVRVVFDAAGAVIARADYEPFGAPIPSSTTGTQPRPQYTGHDRDGEAGVDYFGAWLYVPTLGRLPSVDPLSTGAVADPQRWNRYAYALNSPIVTIDPDGRDPILKVKVEENCGSTCFPGLVPSAGQPSLLGNGAGFTDSIDYFLPQYGYVPDFGSQSVGPAGRTIPAEESFIGTGDVLGDVSGALSIGAVGAIATGAVTVIGEVVAPLARALTATSAAMWDRISGRGAAAAREVGILRDAMAGKGNFGLGSATHAQAEKLGRAWVGEGYTIASNGRALVSADGLRQYRPPSFKPDLGFVQANFERRFVPQGRWQSNGHLDIVKR